MRTNKALGLAEGKVLVKPAQCRLWTRRSRIRKDVCERGGKGVIKKAMQPWPLWLSGRSV